MLTLPLAKFLLPAYTRKLLVRQITSTIKSIRKDSSITKHQLRTASSHDDHVSVQDCSPRTSSENDSANLQKGLYIVSTPIGNLEDITLRALRVLRNADKILCEDTRRTGILLRHFNISTPMESYHLFNENQKINKILDELRRGSALALVSDAGMPAINDPGGQLIAATAQDSQLTIIPVPGPSATLTALAASGLSTTSFTFCGFIESKTNARVKQFNRWKDLDSTLIFFVSPHALLAALEDACTVFGDVRRCCLARELTKTHEEFWRSSLRGALEEFTSRGARGEFTLVVEGNGTGGDGSSREELMSDESILEALGVLMQDKGMPASQAARQVAVELKIPKKRAYALSLTLDRTP